MATLRRRGAWCSGECNGRSWSHPGAPGSFPKEGQWVESGRMNRDWSKEGWGELSKQRPQYGHPTSTWNSFFLMSIWSHAPCMLVSANVQPSLLKRSHFLEHGSSFICCTQWLTDASLNTFLHFSLESWWRGWARKLDCIDPTLDSRFSYWTYLGSSVK